MKDAGYFYGSFLTWVAPIFFRLSGGDSFCPAEDEAEAEEAAEAAEAAEATEDPLLTMEAERREEAREEEEQMPR